MKGLNPPAKIDPMTDANFSRPGAVDLSSLAQGAPAAGGGYVMPLSSEHFDTLRGLRGGLSVNYIAW